MADTDVLQNKHKEVVSLLLEQIEQSSEQDILKDGKGASALFKNAGHEIKGHAYSNFERVNQKLKEIRKAYPLTDNDLKSIALFAKMTSIDIKKSSLFDQWGAVLFTFWLSLFSASVFYKMKYVDKESELFVYLFAGFLVTLGAGFRAILARRRASSMMRSFNYSQIEILVKSLI